MSFTLEYALANYPVGQKRTGKNKQFVFVHNDSAYKGPYQNGRLQNVLSRSAVFKQWNTPLPIHPLEQLNTPDGIFLRFPNLAQNATIHTELYQESFTGLQYNVITSSPLLTLSKSWQEVITSKLDLTNLILSLCHANILGVGDMNLRNILYRDGSLYLIDYDDNLTADRDDESWYFNKGVAAKYSWHAYVTQFYPAVIQKLQNIANDHYLEEHGLLPRYNRVIALLQKYGNIHPNLHVVINVSNVTNVTNVTTMESTSPLNSSIGYGTNGGKNLGKMLWKGIRAGHTKTFSGIDFDVAKSAVQKYIRRNIQEKAILAAIEIYRLGEIGGTAAVSNLFNRLAIIAAEDIGLGILSLS